MADDDGLRSLFPRRWWFDAPPLAIIEIYVDWLLQEIDAQAEVRWPILKTMRGWRRTEVIAYLESYDWTEGVLNTKTFEEGYGNR